MYLAHRHLQISVCLNIICHYYFWIENERFVIRIRFR